MTTPTAIVTTATPTTSLTPFDILSVTAVVFSALSALYGAFCVLFVLAIWSTYRHHSKAYARLRGVTVVLFFVLLTHYISRAIMFGADRRLDNPPSTMKFVIPLVFVGGVASTTAGFITDSLLVWRFYVIFGRVKWALYAPATAVTLTALLGLSGNFQNFAIYHNPTFYANRIKQVSYEVNAIWGWCMFATNTILTGAIIGKIIYITRRAKSQNAADPTRGHYRTILEAIAESSLVTWFGLLLYGVACLAPHGHITTNWDVGYVMICILPIFFGISQCLLIARLGFATSMASASYSFTEPEDREIRITIQKETEIDTHGSIDGHSAVIDVNIKPEYSRV